MAAAPTKSNGDDADEQSTRSDGNRDDDCDLDAIGCAIGCAADGEGARMSAAALHGRDCFNGHPEKGRGGVGITQLTAEGGGEEVGLRRVGGGDRDADTNAGGNEGEGDCRDVDIRGGGYRTPDARLCVCIEVVGAAGEGENDGDDERVRQLRCVESSW